MQIKMIVCKVCNIKRKVNMGDRKDNEIQKLWHEIKEHINHSKCSGEYELVEIESSERNINQTNTKIVV